jgi:hypothetical protein
MSSSSTAWQIAIAATSRAPRAVASHSCSALSAPPDLLPRSGALRREGQLDPRRSLGRPARLRNPASTRPATRRPGLPPSQRAVRRSRAASALTTQIDLGRGVCSARSSTPSRGSRDCSLCLKAALTRPVGVESSRCADCAERERARRLGLPADSSPRDGAARRSVFWASWLLSCRDAACSRSGRRGLDPPLERREELGGDGTVQHTVVP